MSRLTRPAPTSRSASIPRTAAESVRSRLPCLMISWVNATALRVQAKPPRATWSPSRTSAAASAIVFTLLVRGIVDGWWPGMGSIVQVACWKKALNLSMMTGREPDGGAMRDGFKVFDTDTHIRPSAESIAPYLGPIVRERIPDLEEHRVEIKVGMAGEVRQPPYRHWYRFGRGDEGGGWGRTTPRVLGESGPREGTKREFQTFMGEVFPTEGGGDYDARARLHDMDVEGTDVHFIVHGGGAGQKDASLEMEFVKAQHRYLNDFCGTDPRRLKSCLTVTPRAIEESIAEIK